MVFCADAIVMRHTGCSGPFDGRYVFTTAVVGERLILMDSEVLGQCLRKRPFSCKMYQYKMTDLVEMCKIHEKVCCYGNENAE